MAFEFKRLGEVETLSEMKEGLNVLAVDGSEVMKIGPDKIINTYVSDIVDTSVNQAVEEVLKAEGLGEVNETASILVEDDGSLKKVSTDKVVNMAANRAIENVLNVDSLEEVSENANVLVENNGSLQRVPAASIGGGEVCIINIDENDNYTANMTYEEVSELWKNFELSDVVCDSPEFRLHCVASGYMEATIQPCYGFMFAIPGEGFICMPIYYYSDGTITNEYRSGESVE